MMSSTNLFILVICITKAVSGAVVSCGYDVTATEGHAALFNCTTSRTVEVTWGVRCGDVPNPVLIIIDPSGQQYGSQINASGYANRVYFVGNVSVGQLWFKIMKLNTNDSGEYIWRVDHGLGTYTKYVMVLKVKKAIPTCNVSDDTTDFLEGSDVNIICSASAPQTPKITWIWKAPGVNKTTMSEGVGSAVLSIPNIKRDQNGTYECQAKNPTVTCYHHYLSVLYPPTIHRYSREPIVTSIEETVKLTCKADGLPTPGYNWTGSTKPLADCKNKETCTIKIDATDFGNYTCTAFNVVGKDSITISVIEKDSTTSGLLDWQIALIVLGILFGIVFIVILSCYCCCPKYLRECYNWMCPCKCQEGSLSTDDGPKNTVEPGNEMKATTAKA